MKVGVVGRGKVGTALAASAGHAAASITLVSHDALADLQGSDLIVLAVPDAAIAPVASALIAVVAPCAVVHVSGARTHHALAPCAEAGFPSGVMHPLVSFASAHAPPPLVGSTFVLSGDPEAVRRAESFTRTLGAEPLLADVHGPAYHAAAAMTANGAVALAHAAIRIFSTLGIDSEQSRRALAGLLRSVAHNLEQLGTPAALTGPIARGDASTVDAHRRALRIADPVALETYDAIAHAILTCAHDAGLPPEAARAIRALLP